MRIAISGAGVAGPALAVWLHRKGHEPVLIEKAPRFRNGGYMIDFWGVGYTVAERMGVLPAIREVGYSVQEVRLVDSAGRTTGGFGADVFRRMAKGRFISLPRGDLAQVIYQRISNSLEVIFDDSISAIDQSDAGCLVQFERHAAQEFDLVIGADGLHSRVRELALGPQAQFERPLGYYVAAFDAPGYRPRDELVYVSYAIPGREIARFALRGDRTMFLFVSAEEYLPSSLPHDPEGRKSALRGIFAGGGWECGPILEAMDSIEDIYFDRVSQICMDRWSTGRVALVGDAAACVSLLAGEGVGLALTEAYVLAGELDSAGDDYRMAFRNYEQRLRPFIEKKQKAARQFARTFAPRTKLGIWTRNLVTKLLRFPALADCFLGRAVRDDFDLPNYGDSSQLTGHGQVVERES